MRLALRLISLGHPVIQLNGRLDEVLNPLLSAASSYPEHPTPIRGTYLVGRPTKGAANFW